jgi:hypothetical protein
LQFHRVESDSGIVEAFRRPNCEAGALTVILPALDPRAIYRVSDLDSEMNSGATGASLLTEGLRIVIAGKPGATVVRNEKLGGEPAL